MTKPHLRRASYYIRYKDKPFVKTWGWCVSFNGKHMIYRSFATACRNAKRISQEAAQ